MKPLFRSKGSYNCRIIATDPLLYFPLDETSGSVAKNWGSLGASANGSYTGVDLHYTPGPKGGGAPYFDGVNDCVNIYSAALAAAFNGQEGTMSIWAKVYDASVWTDDAYRYMVGIAVDSGNRVRLDKNVSNNLDWVYYAGGSGKSVTLTDTPAGWEHYAITWSKSNNRMKAFYRGVQTGTTQGSLGTWAGELNPLNCCIGAYTYAPTYPFLGYLAHCALWGREFAPAEILALV